MASQMGRWVIVLDFVYDDEFDALAEIRRSTPVSGYGCTFQKLVSLTTLSFFPEALSFFPEALSFFPEALSFFPEALSLSLIHI